MGTGQVSEQVVGATIDKFNENLRVDGERPLRVIVGRMWIYVGCHRISHEAWELLKKLVDGK